MSSDAKAELLRQIRTIRRRIDPDVLARAQKAAEAADAARTLPPDQVPYDKDAARDVVASFLQSRNDGGRFAMALMENLKKPEAAAKAYTDPRHIGRPGGKRV
ncbi:hypothetical protein IP70_09495 [alpha proteobacterium AAP38]|uniref:hypothetical protein n=1 Tax=Niveispirillum sp. TaxID=1917217 RepID=UPI0006B9466E|nr:hypothetical protein IP70_09495 [alpha proteobacterium AAP38]